LKNKNLLDISVIILTYNEELHIERCLSTVCKFASNVILIDSFSDDLTKEIANRFNVTFLQNKWINYANQFNWALDNAKINTEWVLRLDADEYLEPELIEELHQKLGDIPPDVNGIVFKRKHIFMDKPVMRGVYPVKLLRLFRNGTARCEERWMDEHIELKSGKTIEFDHDFVDHNLNSLGWWIQKHNGYSVREAIDLINLEVPIVKNQSASGILSVQAQEKRKKKLKYARMPLFWRAFFYFLYRYFIKRGFLDGKEGFLWHFLQGWWYRTLVDAKIYEIKKYCGNDPQKIKDFISTKYKINL
jgi:glycosyltransferase involved in cell wall biosynthesis